MVNLNSFFSHEINFKIVRVAMKGDAVDLVPRRSVGVLDRIYRFATFQKDPQLIVINRTLAKAFAGNLLEEISAEIFKNETSKLNKVKNMFITNLTHLNEKFINGNKTNFLTHIIWKIANFVRWIFGKELLGYQVLDISDIEKKLNDKVINFLSQNAIHVGHQTQLPASYGSFKHLSTDVIKSHDAVPADILALLHPSCNEHTINEVWAGMGAEKQQAAQHLFETGELQLSSHEFPLVQGGNISNLGIEVVGEVTLPLTEGEFENLQKTLTSSVSDQSRLLAALILVSAGGKAIDLLNFVNKNGVHCLEGLKTLLLTGEQPTTVNPPVEDEKRITLLDRIMDPDNPPILKIEGNPFSLRLDSKKEMFVIQNHSDVPMQVTFEGIIHNGRYLKVSRNSPNKAYYLVRKGNPVMGSQIIEVGVPQNCYYKLASGKSHFIISVEDLKNIDGSNYK